MTGPEVTDADRAVVKAILPTFIDCCCPQCVEKASEHVAKHRHDSSAALVAAVADLLGWIECFADVRSQDDSKTFARVNRGALRTIRDKCRAMLAQMDQTGLPHESSPRPTASEDNRIGLPEIQG